MANIIEAFVAFDTSKLRNAVAIAEAGRAGVRRKKLSPDQTRLIEVRLKGVEHGLDHTKVVGVTPYVNKREVPPLCPTWQVVVPEFLRSLLVGRFSAPEARCIERTIVPHLETILVTYVYQRLVRTSPITWNDLMSDLERLSTASKSLLGVLNGLSPADAVWLRLQAEAPGTSLSGVRGAVATLSQITEAALVRARDQRAEGKVGTYTEPWINLIKGLAGLFEAMGLKPTAAKGSRAAKPKTSPFVEFVWVVMRGAVPKSMREHVSGVQASMAGEVSKVLADRRKEGQSKLQGLFRESPAGKNPPTESKSD
jgi:hypothetical protein